MISAQLAAGFRMTLRQLARNRLALLLLVVVPALFFAMLVLTTHAEKTVRIQLASIPRAEVAGDLPALPLPVDLLELASDPASLTVSQRGQGLVFIALTAAGLVIAFLATTLLQKSADAHRRLVGCGFSPLAMMLSTLAAIACVTVAVAAAIALMLVPIFRPEQFPALFLGLCLGGWVYGCYGLLVGALFRRELVGILAVALLCNIDASWLQNPILYAEAQNQALIRAMPGHFPSQICNAAAFSHAPVAHLAAGAFAWGLALLAAATTVFAWKTRARR